MKSLLTVALIASGIAASGSAFAEKFSNFPTISDKFQSSESCQVFVAEKTAKYGARVLSASCQAVVERSLNDTGSIHAPTMVKSVVGTVILDTI